MKQVKRVSKKEFESEVEDRQTEGYKLLSKTDRLAILKKYSYGGLLGHVLVFLLTFWFTLGIGNIFYALFCMVVYSDEVQLKIGRK